MLNNKQKECYKKYIEGKNVFITGSGGTGKSYLIKKIYDNAIENKKKIYVTAMTGCAAVLLNCKACTLHSWSGIGIKTHDYEYTLRKIKKQKYYKDNWKKIDILVVDEVSMMSSEIFNLLHFLGQKLRCNNGWFGGIQLIFSGDFSNYLLLEMPILKKVNNFVSNQNYGI